MIQNHAVLNFDHFYQQLQHSELCDWLPPLQQAIESKLARLNHGDLPQWLAAFDALPDLNCDQLELDQDALLIGTSESAFAITK